MFACTVCSQQFSTRDDFNQHVWQQGEFQCCQCLEKFPHSPDFDLHLDSHKKQTEEVIEEMVLDNENVVYILENAPVVLSSDNVVLAPEKLAPESTTNAEGALISQSADKPTTVNILQQLSCKQKAPNFSVSSCTFSQGNDQILTPHYKCERCEQIFIKHSDFSSHFEKGKCLINECDVCNANFEKNTDFYVHYVNEHSDRGICNFCFRTFLYERNVKEHMFRHLNMYKIQCEECKKGFFTMREYRNHYKHRHMGVRHICDVCGRSFGDEYYCKKHVASHEQQTNDV